MRGKPIVSGPLQPEGDLHPSFDISNGDRLVASIYASDGDVDRAYELAMRIAEFMNEGSE